MAQLQAQVPDPLREDLPGFLSGWPRENTSDPGLAPGRIGEGILERAAMQVECDHISRRESCLRHVGQEEFVDQASTFNADTRLFLRGRMGRHYDPAALPRRSHSQIRAVIEGALRGDFPGGELLIGRQV